LVTPIDQTQGNQHITHPSERGERMHEERVAVGIG
jgi:hypothetical protein